VKSLKGPLERVLLACMTVGFVLTLLWVATPVLRFADYSLRPVAFVAGAACLAAGLWCLYKSHADLGANWSVTLEVREKQQLVTHGIYRHVRRR
jgi:protein-S-isoprenylcysteine O-methyltransferase Ste14